MKTKMDIEKGLLECYEREKSLNNPAFKSSKMQPRNYGKIHALRWVLGFVPELNKIYTKSFETRK